ncbi:N-acetylglucosamine-6-phosphate deacetylase [Actinocrispum wychmicini]|uniref:N-acetylglucosamine-6-phosphate deacetylase n=1 Tax=Actinocrispum wychmicini TaxID=1213861 RepID=A0A4R2JLV8_9PSEU|nr:N-acetylglucosamine-6-phosphate deacetylase [Actinocrispum wychmicini]TCO58058.1 N-acetylglucosamine-6-phosphate deacetylase [Actinocrispum wychmicini]
MSTVLAAEKALIGRGITGPVSVRIEDGRIVEVTEGAADGARAGLLTPGLVDIQVNGAFGADFAEIDEEGMRRIVSDLPRTGVTRFLPTLITADLSQLLEQARIVLNAVSTVNGQGARSLGVHLEGPFLSPKRPGVHDPSLMVPPTPERVEKMLELPSLRMVTLAPEMPGGIEAIHRLTAAGVLVAVGHTDATGVQTTHAADAGAGMITHLFNAQRGLGHREPGVPGVALVDDRYTLGLIADLAHVGADACRLVFKAAGDRVALVTDAVAAAGMPPGVYRLGGADVLLSDDGVPRSADGTIAGSALTLDRAVRNIISIGVDPVVAFRAATIVPADTIGEPAMGRIEVGALADLVLWDDELKPAKVWVEGKLVHDKETAEPETPIPPHRETAPQPS